MECKCEYHHHYGCKESDDEEQACEGEDRLPSGDGYVMNLEDVREAAAYVRNVAAKEDWERAHGAEDELASDFIQSLAIGKLRDLQAIKQMAGEIFELLHEERTRWYA